MEFTVDELRVIMRALSKFSRLAVSSADSDIADNLFERIDRHRDELIMKEPDGSPRTTDS